MYLLPCSHCQESITVSPSQAGDKATCPSCGEMTVIPKLGDLRQLPPSESGSTPEPVDTTDPMGSRLGFVALGLVFVISLLVAGFCGIRWQMVEVEMTTEQAIQNNIEQYGKLNASELILIYEFMEEDGLDMPRLHKYKVQMNKKEAWGFNALIASILAGASGVGAFVAARSGRKGKAAGSDT